MLEGSFSSSRPPGWLGTTEEGFCGTCSCLIASTGFFPVNRVTSPFRAAVTAGSLFTHSATAHLGSSAVLVPADAQIVSQPRCDSSVLQFLGPGGHLLDRAWPWPCALPEAGLLCPWTHARGQPEEAWATSEAPVCRCKTWHRRPLLRSC